MRSGTPRPAVVVALLALVSLVGYALRTNGPRPYLVVAWHDVPRIVHEIFPRLLLDTAGSSRVNVIDEDGRLVYGLPMRGGDFTVGRRFPTTLYGWRLQVALTSAQELGARVERRKLLELGVGKFCAARDFLKQRGQ